MTLLGASEGHVVHTKPFDAMKDMSPVRGFLFFLMNW